MRLSKASNRNTPTHWVHMFGVRVLFSYETPIAFRSGHGEFEYRRNNDWGPTTGRHISEAGVRDWPIIEDADEFNDKLDHALMVAGMEAFKEKLV